MTTTTPRISTPLAGIEPDVQMTAQLLVLGLESVGIRVEAYAPRDTDVSEWRGVLVVPPNCRQDVRDWACDQRTASLLALGKVVLDSQR